MAIKWNLKIETIHSLSTEDWEGYYGLAGHMKATRRVNSALFNAIKWGRKKLETDKYADPIKVGINCIERVQKVMSRVTDFGFNDTEPQWAVSDFVEKYLNLKMGSIGRIW